MLVFAGEWLPRALVLAFAAGCCPPGGPCPVDREKCVNCPRPGWNSACRTQVQFYAPPGAIVTRAGPALAEP